MKKLFLLFLCIGLFSACSKQPESFSNDDLNSYLETECHSLTITEKVVADNDTSTQNQDSTYILASPVLPVPFGIEDVWLEQNCLYFLLSYTGGCEEHIFNLNWDNTFEVTDSIAGVIRIHFTLDHNSNNDLCEAFIKQTTSFDIMAIKKLEYQEAHIVIEGIDEIFVFTLLVY